MNINRLRPTDRDAKTIDLWFSGLVNDGLSDAAGKGLEPGDAARILLRYACWQAREACWTSGQWRKES